MGAPCQRMNVDVDRRFDSPLTFRGDRPTLNRTSAVTVDRVPRMDESPRRAWHAQVVNVVFTALDSSVHGLTLDEVDRRRATHGRNVLTTTPAKPAWRILAEQFRGVVVGLLVGAATIAWIAGDTTDAAAIGAVLVLNAALGFATELRARRAIAALASLAPRRATVRRTSVVESETEIDSSDLVPGDIIVVEAGAAVPADAYLITAVGLRLNEAALTGESLPVAKHTGEVAEATPLAERTNMIYTGTEVVDGRASAVVVATGMHTEIGRVGGLVSTLRDEPTPLERRLNALGRQLVWLVLALATLVGVLEWWQGLPWSVIITSSLALAVAAVPEGLPAVATIALAVGVHRMARRNALVRRLPSVESLGSVTVICSDKTGTLTAGEMVVTRLWIAGREHIVSGEGYAPVGQAQPPIQAPFDRVIRTAVLAGRGDAVPDGDRWVPHGDPTDVALLVLGRRLGLERQALATEWPEVDEVPFSSDLRLMATFHRHANGDALTCVKGAPLSILERASRWLGPDGQEHQIDSDTRSAIEAVNSEFASQGLRVIAMAEGRSTETGADALRDLTFLGLAGLIDPPAQGVRETIAMCRRAGIRTVMITGDQALTARAVGLGLGLLQPTDEVIAGHTVDGWSDEALAEALPGVGAFSRVSPEAKLRIVAGLQTQGAVVAVLGDGVNDAAALKQADVGVAMGRRGTDVARESADVILQDDWFPTIAAAIEEGRVIYDNIRKFVFYLFSCNLAEILVLLVAGLVGAPPPLMAIQILWLNLVTDTFPALALAMEPAEPGIMDRPPRNPDTALLSKRFLRAITFHSLTIAAVTLGMYWWAQATSPASASTVAFMTLALAQVFHLGTARAHDPVIAPQRIVANRWALTSVVLVFGLQLLTVTAGPLREVLHTTALSGAEWLAVMIAASVPALIGQTIRWWRLRA